MKNFFVCCLILYLEILGESLGERIHRLPPVLKLQDYGYAVCFDHIPPGKAIEDATASPGVCKFLSWKLSPVWDSCITLSYPRSSDSCFAKYLKTCKYQVPANVIGDCIGNAMEDALRTLRNGEPSLGIQPLDPLQVSKLDILQGSGPVSLSVHHRNLTVHGVSMCKVTRNEFDKNDGSLKGTMFCPKIKLDGKYELNGRVLLLPVRGKGRSVIVLDKNRCDFAAHGELIAKNGTLYERYNKIDFTITPQKMTMDFENLFGEDKTLTKTMNQFINENWREILKEMKPSYEAVFENVFKDTVERVFSKIPVKNILPDYSETAPINP